MNKLIRLILTWTTILLCSEHVMAQLWMNGYSYRKKITIDKARVTPNSVKGANNVTIYSDLVDFTALIVLEDADLIHVPGSCGNKIRDLYGRDINLALTTEPSTPLNFQIDRYEHESGKFRLWLRIPQLSARHTATPATSFYLYYGSSILQEAGSEFSRQAWPEQAYSRVWGLSISDMPYAAKDARTNLLENHLYKHAGMNALNYSPSYSDTGIVFNGTSDYLNSGREISTSLTLSAWIKLRQLGQEQVILTNDSTNNGVTIGYKLKVSATGYLIFEMRNVNSLYSNTSVEALQPEIWYRINATTNGFDNSLYINGLIVGSKGGSTLRLIAAGAIRVGSSKQQSAYFNGVMDELMIHKVSRTQPWLQTEYENRKSPRDFYNVSVEEYNSVEFSRFTGLINSDPALSENWQNGIIPETNAGVVIAAAKTLRIGTGQHLIWNNLTLENGATLSVAGTIQVNCRADIRNNSAIRTDSGAILIFGAEVINNGNIQAGNGRLIFSGAASAQYFKGLGSTVVEYLENLQSAATNVLSLNASLNVKNAVKLTRGVLNSNGYLCLLSSKQDGSAKLLPLENMEAGITGTVQVQQYIEGAYPSPGTARGWKLWSSPVYHSVEPGQKYYSLEAFKSRIFITGSGGALNGFDPSPLNSATIYTHDQSLLGSLSQKYIPIPDVFMHIQFGKGVCAFSRGDKHALNAYVEQIQQAPFSNPQGYTLHHSGMVYTGNLSLSLSNRDEGRAGDGFNLVGNPYPAPIYWAGLQKTNLADFVWLFDPVNNAYTISDLPDTKIPSGSGFFVKVINGKSTGSITFREQAKNIHGDSNTNLRFAAAKVSSAPPTRNSTEKRLNIEISRDEFRQSCIIKYKDGGNDVVDDRDAIKLDEGYIDIACVVKGHYLGVNETSATSSELTLKVKGWNAGQYRIRIKGMENFGDASVILVDKYLNRRQLITGENFEYNFNMDQNIAKSHGAERFSLIYDVLGNRHIDAVGSKNNVYPNPFHDVLYLKHNTMQTLQISLIDASGRIIRQGVTRPGENILSGMDENQLIKGLYLLRVKEGTTTTQYKVLKY